MGKLNRLFYTLIVLCIVIVVFVFSSMYIVSNGDLGSRVVLVAQEVSKTIIPPSDNSATEEEVISEPQTAENSSLSLVAELPNKESAEIVEVVESVVSTPARAKTGEHVVKNGDWFSTITGKYWGDIFLWPDLYVLNTMKSNDPDLIYPQEIIDIYESLYADGKLSSGDRKTIAEAYLSVYDIYKGLGSQKRDSAIILLYAATKYDREFLEKYVDRIDVNDRKMAEKYIAESGYLN